MCTLDVMGYAAAQYYTVPFLVLSKMAQKVEKEPTEANKKMFELIKQTCVEIIKGSKKFKSDIITLIINFVKEQKPSGEGENLQSGSTRTQDVVPSLQVLAA